MAEVVPFRPGVPQQRLDITLAGVSYVMITHWNARDNAYYIDVLEADETPVAYGIKVVLGVVLGRRYTHEFFNSGERGLIAVDLSNTGRECGVDELGGRVQIWYLTEVDMRLASTPPLEVPAR